MNQSFQDLLEQAGLTGYSQYFQQDPTGIATALGLKGEQASQFGKFFMPFQQQKLVEAAGEIEAGRQQRLGMIGEQYAGQRMGAQQQLGQSMRQLSQQAAQTGFAGAGATQTAMERLRTGAGQTLQDILGRRETAMLGLEEQVGRQRAGLTSTLQSYLQNIFGRAERLYGLDPGSGEEPAFAGWEPPTNPYHGQKYVHDGMTYMWDSDLGEWAWQPDTTGGNGDEDPSQPKPVVTPFLGDGKRRG